MTVSDAKSGRGDPMDTVVFVECPRCGYRMTEDHKACFACHWRPGGDSDD